MFARSYRHLFRHLVLVLLVFVAAASVRAETTIGQNELPIHDAARMGTRQDVENILRTEPSMRDARTQLGSTPLHYAALNVDSGPLKALIAAGAKINAVDNEGQTALHIAAFATRSDNVRALLEAGADPYAKTKAGRDVLSTARRVRADEIAGMISIWILKGCQAGKPC
ncbi:MAG: ankyrin repeat domain-containing protein [Rhodocyclaceae bacterium]|nr:ankyrin repeat domain-containing protein [Rhodocyclaceae bacterium]